MTKEPSRTSSCRACHGVQRTTKNLRLTSEVLRQEGLCRETFTAGALTCQALQEEWKEWTSMSLRRLKGEKKFRFACAIKGSKTLFDEPCRPCDRDLSIRVKKEWAHRALDCPQVTSPEVLSDIKSRARWYMGTRWWKERRSGVAYVPDQKGCYELERKCGGTLSVPRHWEDGIVVQPSCSGPIENPDGDFIIRENKDAGACRLGTAKKKGKMRVVTMQTARAKRILRPVHESAYDHLCRQPWVVRGEVNSDQMASIAEDHKEGELFTSGDFEASTDNLNKDAVLAVVEVLCEALPERRARVLRDTFEHTWVDWEGERREVVRGSMMGNLLSFVVLCLLNKICLDRARQRSENCGPLYRRALVNGDDLFFSGSEKCYEAWLEETNRVGFVINRSKTMRSARWGDLNSTTYDFRAGRFVRRLCFGFLGTDSWKEPEGSVVGPLFDLVGQLKFSTSAWLLNTYQVQCIFTRVNPPLSLIPRRWWQFLVKKRWFRNTFSIQERDCEVTGSERKLPLILGPPLKESSGPVEAKLARLERYVTRKAVSMWRGHLCAPVEKKIRKVPLPKRNAYPNIRLSRGSPIWRRLWCEPVLRLLEARSPELFDYSNSDWISDQPNLTTFVPLKRSAIRPSAYNFGPNHLLLPDCVPVVLDDGTTVLRVQG
uniref:RNA-dependent RNA polymerase n=1 Tax=Jinan Botou tick virus 1 TaxID=2972079 RepID=A0A9E7V222_9VIRU|nr:MAG: RNA-dependent RNA polymerase [Jinan Botou tick virus 1]